MYLTAKDVIDVGPLMAINQRHQNSRASIQFINTDNSKTKVIVQSSQHLLHLLISLTIKTPGRYCC